MKKSGYLTRKKSNGKIYIYLRRSYRDEGKIKHEYIYSFGAMPNALEKMYYLRDNPDDFPEKLSERKFHYEDLRDWIATMEVGITSHGRSFEL